jgi:NADPH:quinone reductase-like Zn-dependent oxidoreductase
MRAAVLTELGKTPEVADFREPEAADGQVVVDVLAAGLNPIDIRTAAGGIPARIPPLPSVVGMEGIGRTADGRRVYFPGCVQPWGSVAERAVVEEAGLVELAEDLEDAHAVCFGIAGTAAWGGLHRRGRIQAGEKVLILAASGVVGMIAVQVAKLAGAAHVTAAARSEAGLARAAELGADATVRLDTEGEELTRRLLDAAGGPLDLVFDPLWGAPAAAAIEALKPGGRLVQLGQSAGATATLPSASVRFKELSILGYTNFMSAPQEQEEALTSLWRHAAAGELRADHEVSRLDDAPAAWERQAQSPGHKLVIAP